MRMLWNCSSPPKAARERDPVFLHHDPAGPGMIRHVRALDRVGEIGDTRGIICPILED